MTTLKRREQWLMLVGGSVLLQLGCVAEAQAYIDPGAGSYLFQILIGGVMAAGFMFRQFRNKVTIFFRSLLGRGTKEKGSVETRDGKGNNIDGP